MFNRHVIRGLLAGMALVAASTYANATHGGSSSCCGSSSGHAVAAPGAPAPGTAGCGPTTRTVTTYEMVPEQYETTRTTYKTEYVTETYTAYRTECVPEVRTRTRTITKKVPEYRDETRCTYKCVPTTETRTTYKKVKVCKEICTTERKCVDNGHWEEQCVPASPGLLSCLKKKSCCDPCCDPCPPMKTKRVWVSCKTWVETPVTKKITVTECIPCTETVCVMKKVPHYETVKVCTYRCVTECVTENYTVNTTRCVPYTATRQVAKCVPVCEKVMACRMVCKPVTKEVPVCEPSCDPCATYTSCCSGGLFSRLFGRKGGSCCGSTSSCGCGCN